MKKALGGLFTRPYQSPEAHGTAGAPGVFSLARFQFLLLPSQDGVRPRPLLPAPPPVPPPQVPPLQQTLAVKTLLQVQVQCRAWPRRGWRPEVPPSSGCFVWVS